MRVLVAFDGSTSAGTALELVRALAWPAGTLVRVAQVIPPPPPFVGSDALADVDARLVEALASSVGRSWSDTVTVDARLVVGDAPADAIVAEARRIGADLIVTGHRGHGAMATVFMGSVARDITEHAPCPVLVARGSTIQRIVVADDGSAGAFRARKIVSTWPIFKAKHVDVVSVAHVARPLLAGIAVSVRAEAREAQAESEMEARVAYSRLANEAADGLRLAGLHAAGYVRSGDPAEQICGLARERGADVIVMGTRGRGTIGRVLVGSVARAVLLSAPCSVLVVPD
ncbi:MAG TPA: universal stress protein [Candidatus Limnocylindria bacterium]|nr:universal stress protein [Candidatus Limnocylindria bacterium]